MPMPVSTYFTLPDYHPPTSLTSQDPHFFPRHPCPLMFPHQQAHQDSTIRPPGKALWSFCHFIKNESMCIPAILHALIWKPSLTTAVPIEKAWASTKPLVTSFRPARWAPVVLELLEDSGTRVSSWNPASFLAKHYPSATGLCLTDGLS